MIIIAVVFIIISFVILPLGFDGMADRMGINWARGVALAGFFFPVIWLALLPFIPAGYAIRRDNRRIIALRQQIAEQQKIAREDSPV